MLTELADRRLAGPGDLTIFEALALKAQTLFSVAGSPRGQAALLAAMLERREALNLVHFSDYAAYLRQHPEEWPALWPRALAAEAFLWKPPAVFEVAREVLCEWAALAPERQLKILSLGCGAGHETVSLAIMIEESGLRAKGWQVEIHGLDLNPQAVEKARLAVFHEEALLWLTPAQRRKWFQAKAGGWAFKQALAAPLLHSQADAFEPETWPGQSLPGRFDLIFCRGLTWDAPPRAGRKLAMILRRALAPVGFIFTAAGEFLPDESGELDLEERTGVAWYRRGPRRLKLNPGHVTRKQRKAGRPAAAGPAPAPPAPDPREEHLLFMAREALAQNQPDQARDFLNEALYSAQEQGRPAPRVWLVLAEVETRLNRPDLARALTRAAEAFGEI